MFRTLVLAVCLLGLLSISGQADACSKPDDLRQQDTLYCRRAIAAGCCSYPSRRQMDMGLLFECTGAIMEAVREDRPGTDFPRVCCKLQFFMAACKKAGFIGKKRNYSRRQDLLQLSYSD